MDDNVKKAINKAKYEIMKSCRGMDFERHINKCAIYSDYVIKNLIAITVDCKMDQLFPDIIDNKSTIDYKHTNGNTYKFKLSIVDKDYSLELGDLLGNKTVKSIMGQLLSMTRIVYCPLKDYMKKKIKTFNYVLQLDHNTNLYLDKNSKKRVGIVMNKY